MFETELMRVIITEATHRNLKTKREVLKLAKEMDKKQILSKKYLDLIAQVVTDANRFI